MKSENPLYQAESILARRDHSVAELQQKLRRKGFTATQIEEAVVNLKERKLLDDTRVARRYAAWILEMKAVGPRWLQMKLRQKQFNAPDIEMAVAEAYVNVPEADVARRAAEVWCRMHPRYAQDQQRLRRFLISRGFSSQSIEDAMGR